MTTQMRGDQRTRGPKRYDAKKTKRRPKCAIPGCPHRAQSVDSPHCSFHQPMLPMFDDLLWITAAS